jgi:hypothetical protein
VPPSPLLDAHCRALVNDLKKQANAAKYGQRATLTLCFSD